MQKDNVKIGDIVMLNSGGPTMTVAKLGRKKVLCSWFTNDCESYSCEYDYAVVRVALTEEIRCRGVVTQG